MSSAEDQILSRVNDFQRANMTLDLELLLSVFSEDITYYFQPYPPITSKAQAREVVSQLFENNELYSGKRVNRAHKIHVSDSDDIATMWLIEDTYMDDTLVGSSLILSGWVKKNGIWYMESVSGQDVPNGWTW